MMAITLAKGQGLSLEKSQHNLSLVTIGLGGILLKKDRFFGRFIWKSICRI
jgi:stress response protein SCP2